METAVVEDSCLVVAAVDHRLRHGIGRAGDWLRFSVERVLELGGDLPESCWKTFWCGLLCLRKKQRMQKEGRRHIYSKAATERMDGEVVNSLSIW